MSNFDIYDENYMGINNNLSDMNRKSFNWKNDYNSNNTSTNFNNKIYSKRITRSTYNEEENKFMEDNNFRSSSLNQRPKKKLF